MRLSMLCAAVLCATFTPSAPAFAAVEVPVPSASEPAPVPRPAPVLVPRVPSRAAAFTLELMRAYAQVKTHRTTLGQPVPERPRLSGVANRRAQLEGWRARARRAAAAVEQAIPHRAQWMCISSHEAGPEHGGWAANTGNGYFGGLQMDRSFQQTYAPGLYRAKGTADNWTREEQMRTAEKAWATRGFSPWPNTARICGLL